MVTCAFPIWPAVLLWRLTSTKERTMQDDQSTNEPASESAGHPRVTWTEAELAIFREGIATITALRAQSEARKAVSL